MFIGVILLVIVVNNNYDVELPTDAKQVYLGEVMSSNRISYYVEEYKQIAPLPDADILFDRYLPGDRLYVFVGAAGDVVSVAPRTNSIIDDLKIAVLIIIVLVLPIAIVIFHVVRGFKKSGGDWFLYLQWYKVEIEPHEDKVDFEEIVAQKQFFNITTDINSYEEEDKRVYKKNRNIVVIYTALWLLLLIVFSLYFYDNGMSIAGYVILTGITVAYMSLATISSKKMAKIKQKYIKRKKNQIFSEK